MADAQPTETVGRAAYTVLEFCQAHRISRSLFYEMRKNGLAPKQMKVGSRTLISAEAAKEWRRAAEREPITIPRPHKDEKKSIE